MLAVSLYKTGKHEQAKKYFEVAQKKGNAEAMLYLANYKYDAYDFDGCEELIGNYASALKKTNKEMGTEGNRMAAKVSKAKDMINHVEKIVVFETKCDITESSHSWSRNFIWAKYAVFFPYDNEKEEIKVRLGDFHLFKQYFLIGIAIFHYPRKDVSKVVRNVIIIRFRVQFHVHIVNVVRYSQVSNHVVSCL